MSKIEINTKEREQDDANQRALDVCAGRYGKPGEQE